MVEKTTPFTNALNQFNCVNARMVWDSAGCGITRTEIKFDKAVIGTVIGEPIDVLKQGEYTIYFRGYKVDEGITGADVCSVDCVQPETVARRIGGVISQEKNVWS